MKKIFTALFVLGYTVFSFAQTIPNNEFETWSGGKPTGWDAPNVMGTNTVNEETASPQSGLKSVKIETKTLLGNTLPGFITLGIFNLSNQTITGGIPFPYRPSKLKGYYKCQPGSGDNGFIGVGLSKIVGGVEDTIGKGMLQFPTAVTVWTPFEVPITWSSPDVPDSLNIIIASSDLSAGSYVVGSLFWVDSLYFEFPTVSSPVLSTTVVSGITDFSAISGGDITSDGGAAVTERGVCWSTNANPTINDSHTSDGSGTGVFSSSITGLSSGTLYHVRAYATNSSGTSYGQEETFTTLLLPSLVSISPSSANAGETLNVTITGVYTHFMQATWTTVDFEFNPGSGVVNSFNVIDDYTIDANITVPSATAAGDYDVYVNNAMDGALSLVNGFHVNGPYLVSINPSSANAGVTLNVTITGADTHFMQATWTTVDFGFNPGSGVVNSYNVIDDYTIDANISIPSITATGYYDVYVDNAIDGALSLINGFYVDILISINSYDNDNISFDLYPNPANKTITVTFNTTYNANTIEIINALGQTVSAKQVIAANKSELLDISAIKPGVYFIKAQTDKGSIIKKLIKE